MISAWHLVWLLPVAAALGFAVCALLTMDRDVELEWKLAIAQRLCNSQEELISAQAELISAREELISAHEKLIKGQQSDIEVLKRAIDTLEGKSSGGDDG
jgi:hypothetical protein